MCDRDICIWNSLHKGCTRYDPNDLDDYRDTYCPKCYELRFVKYKIEYSVVEEERERILSRLAERIKSESLKQ